MGDAAGFQATSEGPGCASRALVVVESETIAPANYVFLFFFVFVLLSKLFNASKLVSELENKVKEFAQKATIE